jgi:hypothetical protein
MDALATFGIVIAGILAGALLIGIVLGIISRIHDRRRLPIIGEREARENCKPYLDPITPAYYGLPPHNGAVDTEPREEGVA